MAGKTSLVTAVAVAGALVAGCGSGSSSDAGGDPSASASAGRKFDKAAVRTDLVAAVTAAGLPGDVKAAGLPGDAASGQSAAAGVSEREKLAARVADCTVDWASFPSSPSSTASAGGDELRRKVESMLDGLAGRGWKEKRPFAELPVGEGGVAAAGMYKKRGWTLHARYYDLKGMRMASVGATEDACVAEFSEEELDLLDSGASGGSG